MEKITSAIKMVCTQYQTKLNQEKVTQHAEHVARTKYFSLKTGGRKTICKA
jgi:hypothetical protein